MPTGSHSRYRRAISVNGSTGRIFVNVKTMQAGREPREVRVQGQAVARFDKPYRSDG